MFIRGLSMSVADSPTTDQTNVSCFREFIIIFTQHRCESNPACCNTFLRSAVCLSVCHVRAPCLNHSTDLDAIWQIHLQCPTAHCVRWGSRTPSQGKGGDLGSNPQPKHGLLLDLRKSLFMIHQMAASISDSIFLLNYFGVCFFSAISL